jgi:hypothetical protein
MSNQRAYSILSLVIGVLLVLVGIALVVLRLTRGGSALEYMAAIIAMVAGAISIVRALGQLSPEEAEPELDDTPLAEPPPEQVVPVEPARALHTAAMTVGAAAFIGGATWFRVELYDGFTPVPPIIALAGLVLFGWAYGRGRRVTSELPKLADTWDRGAAWVVEHGAVPALLLLTLITAVMFSRIFLGETTGDDNTFHMAESRRIADCLRAGDWDFWNPSANAGYASAYYYQVIPQLASAIPTALFGDDLFLSRSRSRRIAACASWARHRGRHCAPHSRSRSSRAPRGGAQVPTARSMSASTPRPGHSRSTRSGSATACATSSRARACRMRSAGARSCSSAIRSRASRSASGSRSARSRTTCSSPCAASTSSGCCSRCSASPYC